MKQFLCFSGAMPQVCRLTLQSPRVGADFADTSIAFVTDIHYGRWLGDRAMEKIIRLIMDEKPRLIILGGDLAEGIQAQKRLMERYLPHLRAPMGVFAVPGNNDYEALEGDYDLWGQMLKKAGVQLLYNRRAILPGEGGRLVISGLDESKYGHPDPAVALEPLNENDLHLLVTHSPWALSPVMEGGPRVDMALCGHTHGGQIALSKKAALWAMGYKKARNRPYFFLCGDHRVNGTRVLVSNGIGCSLMPLRLGAPPQIHIITLKA